MYPTRIPTWVSSLKYLPTRVAIINMNSSTFSSTPRKNYLDHHSWVCRIWFIISKMNFFEDEFFSSWTQVAFQVLLEKTTWMMTGWFFRRWFFQRWFCLKIFFSWRWTQVVFKYFRFLEKNTSTLMMIFFEDDFFSKMIFLKMIFFWKRFFSEGLFSFEPECFLKMMILSVSQDEFFFKIFEDDFFHWRKIFCFEDDFCRRWFLSKMTRFFYTANWQWRKICFKDDFFGRRFFWRWFFSLKNFSSEDDFFRRWFFLKMIFSLKKDFFWRCFFSKMIFFSERWFFFWRWLFWDGLICSESELNLMMMIVFGRWLVFKMIFFWLEKECFLKMIYFGRCFFFLKMIFFSEETYFLKMIVFEDSFLFEDDFFHWRNLLFLWRWYFFLR